IVPAVAGIDIDDGFAGDAVGAVDGADVAEDGGVAVELEVADGGLGAVEVLVADDALAVVDLGVEGHRERLASAVAGARLAGAELGDAADALQHLRAEDLAAHHVVGPGVVVGDVQVAVAEEVALEDDAAHPVALEVGELGAGALAAALFAAPELIAL